MRKKPENIITYEMSCLHEGVTGSSIMTIFHFPNGVNKQILVDCGTFQEYEYKSYNDSLPFKPGNIDYVFLTHTHIDHCGRLPYLVKEGYSNKIYCTKEAKSMIIPALFDCAKILDSEAKLATKIKKKLVLPLYESEDVKKTLKLTYSMNYNKTFELDENLSVTFLGNGHIMGAALILIQVKYPECESINLLFTGDYNVDNLFQEVPEIPDWVKNLKLIIVQEATYGDSTTSDIHYTYEETILDLINNNRTVISPIIACERTEQVLLKLKNLQDNNLLSKRIPIFLAGTLACEYFKLYACNSKIDFIPQNLVLVTSKEININSPMLENKNVSFIQEIPDNIIESKGPKIILTTSGMADKGKAPYYLSKLVNRDDVSVFFTCYLPSNTLGYSLQRLKKGADYTFCVFGEKIKVPVNAEVLTCNEFSSHAKSDQLIDFLKFFPNLVGVFVNHGTLKIKEDYAQEIIDKLDPNFVEILDRNVFYSMYSYEIIKCSNSKYANLIDIKNSAKKENKERKSHSKKTTPRLRRPRLRHVFSY